MTDDERWSRDIATLRRAAEELTLRRRNGLQKPRVVTPFERIAHSLDDPSPEVREKAVRELYELDPDQAATLVNEALRDGSPEERRRIGTALADSGRAIYVIRIEGTPDLRGWRGVDDLGVRRRDGARNLLFVCLAFVEEVNRRVGIGYAVEVGIAGEFIALELPGE